MLAKSGPPGEGVVVVPQRRTNFPRDRNIEVPIEKMSKLDVCQGEIFPGQKLAVGEPRFGDVEQWVKRR